jgi:hypothetical protein
MRGRRPAEKLVVTALLGRTQRAAESLPGHVTASQTKLNQFFLCGKYEDYVKTLPPQLQADHFNLLV